MTTTLIGWPKTIAEILGCDAATARSVFEEMCGSGFDFSEATKTQLVRECKLSLEVVRALEEV